MRKYNLFGEWRIALDAEKKFTNENVLFTDSMFLPSTTAIEKKGEKNTKRETGFLTELYPFEGYVWYSREFSIDDSDLDKRLFISLERTRMTRLWINDIFVGECNSLTTSHKYEITGFVKEPKFKITLLVSNTDYPTKGGHLTSPDTQTNWNGILGDISLIVAGTSVITNIFADSDIDTKKVSMDIEIDCSKAEDCQLSVKMFQLDASDIRMKNEIHSFNFPLKISEGINSYSVSFIASDALLWSEYDHNIYEISLLLSNECTQLSEKKFIFGLRSFNTDGKNFTINNIKTMLRGKHDGMIFPRTGAAPCDVSGWLKVMRTAKTYGINHYRFHTCCPPDAAFAAADILGIYMEPELPFWGTIAGKGEEGYNEIEQEYLIEEGYRMMREFGNHPSFCMFSLGNELWGNPERLSEILRGYKSADKRHLYTQGSNNFQHVPVILPEEDFWCGVRLNKQRLIRGSYGQCDAPLGHVQTEKPSTRHNYDKIIESSVSAENTPDDGAEIEIQYGTGVKKVKAVNTEDGLSPKIPIVTHEIGQYAVWPHLAEAQKYNGVLRAYNFDIFGERLEEKGMYHLNEQFFRASGMLSAQCYKEELEAAHRSENIAGYQILDIQDFSGQGTATVGMLDAFMDSKSIISAENWRSFCSDCVLLAQFDSYILTYGSTFTADISISYFNFDTPLKSQKLLWYLGDFACGEFEIPDNSYGLTSIGKIDVRLPDGNTARKIPLTLSLSSYPSKNNYNLFIYPDIDNSISPEVNLVHTSSEANALLSEGKNVLLIPNNVRNGIKGFYCSDFWCYSMFKAISEWMGREIPVGTLGLLIDNEHPVFRSFPTEFYSEPQWWSLVESCDTTILDGEKYSKIDPIVYTIDNFERCHKLGLMFECRVSSGKLFVLNAKVHTLTESPEAAMLLRSISDYILSDEFNPSSELTENDISCLFE